MPAWSAKKRKKFESAWARGATIKEIMAEFGMEYTHVISKASQFKLPRRRLAYGSDTYDILEGVIDELSYALENKISLTVVGEELGVTGSAIWNFLKRKRYG